ncbi:hypothetical protein TTHERM_00395760 (macronuclear) [Tetrahymena thermophila SB210]|uniref:Uncharacterized protein n=1 Tax=Tetrahymena thermophila (strain SB210) TaxID=312017 RepID=Q232X7_TETTS|nr:hypothetical protein TTHERM_00395760 [Tetrahymena thermophila SB210]EAR91703.2 hypothetical protein TTHERM_00395760 [Tetrahymena thermophila SB210]|eukprot:XP_001011948.2 hypothetical protein TTHERM_00395760 [Tetrahymena thermophila SB210]
MELEESHSHNTNSSEVDSYQYSSNSVEKDSSQKSTCSELQPLQIVKTVIKRAKKIPIFLQKLSKQKKKEQLKKYNFLISPLCFLPSELLDVYANGDVILEYDFLKDPETNKKTLNWSYIKQITNVEVKEDMNTIEIRQSVNVEQKKDLQHLYNKYINTPDQKTHELGIVLRQFEIQKTEILNSFFNMVKMNPNILEPLFKLQQKYVAACLDWIKKNISQNKYFFYAFGSYNQKFKQYEQNHIGFSKPLLELLGFDGESFKNYILRKGRFEIYNSLSRMEMIIQKIQYGIESWSEKKWDVVLLTIEDIPVYCQQRKLAISIKQFQDIIQEYKLQNIINESWIDFINLCGITEFFIDENQIQNVLNQRRQINQYDPISDLAYTAQSEILIEKFYKSEYEDIQKKQQQFQNNYYTQDEKIIIK